MLISVNCTFLNKIKHRIVNFVFIACLLVNSCHLSTSKSKQDNKDGLFIDEIEILYTTDASMFPESWRIGDINGKALELDSSEYERTTQIIQTALSKYPPGFAKNYLKKIYVVAWLEFYGVPYGGTNTDGIIYIANNGEDNGYTNKFIEQTFHHEFSSILLNAHPEFFDKNNWLKNNYFEYGEGGVNAIKQSESSMILSEHYATMGALCQYGTSALEEDFNTFAEQLFCGSDLFWDFSEKYTLIAEKTNIIINFYHQLHPNFTKEYFTKFANQ